MKVVVHLVKFYFDFHYAFVSIIVKGIRSVCIVTLDLAWREKPFVSGAKKYIFVKPTIIVSLKEIGSQLNMGKLSLFTQWVKFDILDCVFLELLFPILIINRDFLIYEVDYVLREKVSNSGFWLTDIRSTASLRLNS